MRLLAIFAAFVFAAFALTTTTDQAEARKQFSTSPRCLPKAIKARLSQIRRKFGRIKIISTYRRGARIRGSGRPSKHASCRAVDFKVRNKKKVYTWLKRVHRGGLGLYYGKCSHIHIDNGMKLRWVKRGC